MRRRSRKRWRRKEKKKEKVRHIYKDAPQRKTSLRVPLDKTLRQECQETLCKRDYIRIDEWFKPNYWAVKQRNTNDSFRSNQMSKAMINGKVLLYWKARLILKYSLPHERQHTSYIVLDVGQSANDPAWTETMPDNEFFAVGCISLKSRSKYLNIDWLFFILFGSQWYHHPIVLGGTP